MLIDGEKWACEACVRGHRVTTCKHHDRPLIHINRKGRPFATCSICNCTPCEAPEDHAKLKREAEAKCQSSKRAAGRSPRSTSVGSLKPIAPRPAPSSMTGGGDVGPRRDDSHSPPAVGGYGEFVGRGGGGRLRSTLSSSPPPPPQPPIPSSSSSQLYQQGHDFVTATTSPADSSSPMYHLNNNNNNTTTTTTSYPSPPSFCTMVDMPSSLSMINPLDFGSGVVSPFADSAAAAAAIYALEDLDVNALPADVFQGDWSWLADEAALRDAV